MPSPTLCLAVFDLDGTIVDSTANIVRAVHEAAALMNLEAPPASEVPRVIGLSLTEALGQLFPALESPRLLELDRAYRECFVRFRGEPDFDEPLFDGTHELLDALDREGIVLGIATGKAMRGVKHVLDRHGLSNRFVTIQTPEQAPGKPHPGMLYRAMAETGALPANTVMIGDTSFDMLMARSAGVSAVGVAWGNHPIAELQAAGAHRLVDRLSDLHPAVRALTSAVPTPEAAAARALGLGIEPMEEPKPRVREGAPPKPRRVYKGVSVGSQADGTFPILLDGKTAFTPLRAKLAAASSALADAVAKEWDAQDPHIDPETMPLTRLLATQIDRVGPQRGAVIASLISYVDADSICYRAPYPAELRERQARQWQPVLDWLVGEHDLILHSSEGAMPAVQQPAAGERIRRILESLGDAELTGFQAAAAQANSLALALALVYRRLSAGEVFAAAFLDELYQVEKWGEDQEAAGRRKRIAGDLEAIERFLLLSV